MDEVQTKRAPDPAVVGSITVHITPAQPPIATYRIQFYAGFTFQDAERIVPYLAELGVGALYASPIFKAVSGSTHGYDVIDYSSLNPEIGSEAEFRSLVDALQRHGLGLILDFVPNHMGIAGGGNAWWLDVLENGQASTYSDFFDIDWQPLKAELRNKVLIPILGDHYGAVLERGELQLRYDDGAFTAWYFDRPLPIAPPSYPLILRQPLDDLAAHFADEDLPFLEYQSLLAAFERLPSNAERDPEQIAERQREQTVAKRRLAELVRSSPELANAIEETVRSFNGQMSDPRSFDALDALLETQSYRLAFWRTAAEEINYRRFFAINELAAIRQEIPEVFASTHALLLRLIGEGTVMGVRIDHPDGLWDPAGYLAQLQRAAFLARARHLVESDHSMPPWEEVEPALLAKWDESGVDARQLPLYLVVEKILEHDEALPADWAVHGTVGYEFGRAATGLFVDSNNRKAFDDLYTRFTKRERQTFADLVYETKQLIMRVAFASEVNLLARALNRISEQHRRTRDYTLNNIRFAMQEIIACFPIYRTYAVCGEGQVLDRDKRYITQAVAEAKRRNPASDPSVFNFVRDVLLLQDEDMADEHRAERCQFGMKFQQLTGPVMAKGLEDTAFYIYNRLTSLNEVGGDPTTFGVTMDEFHRQNADRLQRWPATMLTSSTHDTKRSEDVRARIDVFSEIPREWRAAINRWARHNRWHKTRVEGSLAPDRNDEYLFYQTLLGAWPLELDKPDKEFVDRIEAYMLKAIREAQVHTSWINPNVAYDEATSAFVRSTLKPKRTNPFFDDFAAFRERVAQVGMVNSLAQQLLKLTAPGVPDLYQGTELWDFSLVDPDNRRPVDYDRRRRFFRDLKRRKPGRRLAADLWNRRADGAIKLYLTHHALACRQADPHLFERGDYVPLGTCGRRAEHLCVYARRFEDREVIIAIPRLMATFMKGESTAPVGADVWSDTRILLPDVLPGTRYRDSFTNEILTLVAANGVASLPVESVFATLPVALLVRHAPEGS